MDGEIDYSGYTLDELRETARVIESASNPLNFKNLRLAIAAAEQADSLSTSEKLRPSVDVLAPEHQKPKITPFMFRARCPLCGWRLPILHKDSRLRRKVFPCSDCHSPIRLTAFWRSLNPVLYALLVPFMAWFSFGGISQTNKFAIVSVLIVLAILNYWFERLEVVENGPPSLSASGKS